MRMGTEIKMKPHEIADAIRSWHAWPGFSGESCARCYCTVNTFGHGPGWFCPNPNCKADAKVELNYDEDEYFNNQSFSNSFMPHRHPRYGPTLQIIRKGCKLAQKRTIRNRKFSDDQKVFVNLRHWPFSYTEAIWRQGRIVKMVKSICGLRWYLVRLSDGKENRFIEEDICKSFETVPYEYGGGRLDLVPGDRALCYDYSDAWVSTHRGESIGGGVAIGFSSRAFVVGKPMSVTKVVKAGYFPKRT